MYICVHCAWCIFSCDMLNLSICLRLKHAICGAGQNHAFIGIYGVSTVVLAKELPHKRSCTVQIYGADILRCRYTVQIYYGADIRCRYTTVQIYYGADILRCRYTVFRPTLVVCYSGRKSFMALAA